MRSRICAECGSPRQLRLLGRDGAEVDYDPTLEDYMVHNEIWEKARMGRGLLHLKCLERRLGRDLTLEDFTSFPVNNSIRFAHRMGRRSVGAEYEDDLGRRILELSTTTGLEPVYEESPT